MANATDVLIRFILTEAITEPQFLVFLSYLWKVLREISSGHRAYQLCPRATLRGSGGDPPSGLVVDVVWSFKYGPRRGIAWVIAKINAWLFCRNEKFAIRAAVSAGDCDSYGGLNYGFAQQDGLLEDVRFYLSQKAQNDSVEEMDEDKDVCNEEPRNASDVSILGDTEEWWQVKHHRASLSSEAEPLREEIASVITATIDIDRETGACDFEEKRQLGYVAKLKELQVKEVDLFAHLTEPAHVQIMDAILPGWQHPTSFLEKFYFIVMLQAAPPPLSILTENIADYVFPKSAPLQVVAERLWHWGSDASGTPLVPSLRPWDTCANAGNRKIQILRKRLKSNAPDSDTHLEL